MTVYRELATLFTFVIRGLIELSILVFRCNQSLTHVVIIMFHSRLTRDVKRKIHRGVT